MFNTTMLSLALVLGASAPDTVTLQLRDSASITGKLLAEKKDQVVIDAGYSVLVIPRSQVLKMEKPVAPKEKEKNKSSAGPAVVAEPKKEGGFYSEGKSSTEMSVRDWVKQIGEAVVQVRTPKSIGSGFFINEEGNLITNFHVIEGETQISVEVYHQKKGQLERKTYRQVKIVALNKFADLAMLKIDEPDLPKFETVPLGDVEQLAVGERVFAIGSPLGLERTVTEGIVSTKTRVIEGELYLQTSAQINPGNSGGPLFNMRGEVVGVINLKYTMGEGLGFAIPADGLKHFLNNRDAYAYDNDNPTNPYRYLEPVRRSKAVIKDSKD